MSERLNDTAVLAHEAGLDLLGYRIVRVAVELVGSEVSAGMMRRRVAQVRAARLKAVNVGSGGGSGGDDQARHASTPTAAASDAGDVADTVSAILPQTREG